MGNLGGSFNGLAGNIVSVFDEYLIGLGSGLIKLFNDINRIHKTPLRLNNFGAGIPLLSAAKSERGDFSKTKAAKLLDLSFKDSILKAYFCNRQ